jgi:hypothetical protein
MGVDAESRKKRAIMLVLKLVGGLSWIGAYQEAIAESRAGRPSLLPESALAFNIAWEAIYSLGGAATWRRLTVEDRTQTVLNVAWLVQDIRWVRSLQPGERTQLHRPALLASAVIYQLAFLSKMRPGDAARVSALLQNLAFSAYCAAVQPTGSGESSRARRFTALRAAGTAVPTATSGALRGIRPRYLLPGLGCVACDSIRLYRQRSSHTHAPQRHRPDPQ